MDKQQIIEKVRKILAKTTENGATPAEAATAMALAQKLMADNGIFLTDVEGTTKDEIVEECTSLNTKSVSNYQWHLAKELSKHFACQVLIKGNRRYGQSLLFIGESVKVELFKECFLFAYNSYQKSFKTYVGTEKNDLIGYLFGCVSLTRDQKLQKRWDYFMGFVDGLTNELIKSENENALVVVESPELQDYMSKMKITTTKCQFRSIQSQAAMEAGYQDGSYAFRNKHQAVSE